MQLTDQDKTQLQAIGIPAEEIISQFRHLKSGPEKLNLERPAIIGDGILSFSESELQTLVLEYDELIKSKTVTRFTPASGAATRMFKHLLDPLSNATLANEFIQNISDFAFYPELKLGEQPSHETIISKVLNEGGLNYGKLPKALISFHKYPNEIRKAIDEQLVEGLKYVSVNGVSKFHFTISTEHDIWVREYLQLIVPSLEKRFQTHFDISFSTQHQATDTIALNENLVPVREDNGRLLLRPGGHGALIHNLNELNADIVFVKNIDNIVREEFQNEIVRYKKVLGSLLIQEQSKIFTILEEMESGKVSELRLTQITHYIKSHLGLTVKAEVSAIQWALNKPIRVCGMVKNEGKAGGGPFWVSGSLQIVESAQMDVNDPEVLAMLANASHFNPVDLVCGLRDYKGRKFDLTEFIDPKTFFVSSKSFKGDEIKVLEHPGLWNGAMANWLTLFVSVPVSTFHPVKTVNDLLQSAHKQ